MFTQKQKPPLKKGIDTNGPKSCLSHPGRFLNTHANLCLQRELGNQALQQFFNAQTVAGESRQQHQLQGLSAKYQNRGERHSAPSNTGLGIRAKLKISTPNDPYEKEADRVANTIMNPGTSVPARSTIQAYSSKPSARQPDNSAQTVVMPQSLATQQPTHASLTLSSPAATQYPFTKRLISNKAPGSKLPAEQLQFFESRFERDFSQVRIHTGNGATLAAGEIGARAFTLGNDIYFSNTQYAPHSLTGKKLLAHELTHVAQQNTGAVIHRTPEEIAILQRRLRIKINEREQLRQRMEASSQQFSDEVLQERSDEAFQHSQSRLRSQAQSDLQRTMLQRTRQILQRAVTITVSNNEYFLRTNIELSFAALPDSAARQQAIDNIPRLRQAITSVWNVDMQQGRYAGRRFRLIPNITFRPSTQTRRQDALQIIVRGEDSDPSSGDFLTGEISLANAHLRGNRIVVVAHELAHLFGDFDTYLIDVTPDEDLLPGQRRHHSVGRNDASGRVDLMGMIDPVVLRRWLQAGEITQAEYNRQTRIRPQLWQEDADNILFALGVPPIPENERPMPSPDNPDYIDEAERRLEAQRRTAQQRLEDIRRRHARSISSIEWVQMAERAMQLDAEIAELRRQISELQ